MHTPFFSILIPSYNRPDSLGQCIESVLGNEGEDFEIIISDDASPDTAGILNIVRPYRNGGKIRFHQQHTNLGEPANRNFLVSQATGRYNIILCDDDILRPHGLRTIRSYIEQAPNQDIYLFGYQVIDESGRRCYDRMAPRPLLISLEHPQLVRHMFEATWLPFLICHPSTFCCRRGIETAIPYRNDVSTADDYMFLLECLNKGKRMYILPECLLEYRWAPSRNGGRQINQSADNLRVLQGFAKIYYVLQQQPDLHPLISTIIRSSAYRERFLFDLMIRRLPSLEAQMPQLGLPPAQGQELSIYAARRIRFLIKGKTAADILRELAQVFGVRGFLYSIRIFLVFLRYRVLAN